MLVNFSVELPLTNLLLIKSPVEYGIFLLFGAVKLIYKLDMMKMNCVMDV